MSTATDAHLLALLKSEPEKGLRLIYERYASPLLRFAIRFTEDQAAAEDILHDIFSELLDGKFREMTDANLKGWLFTVAKNKSLNSLRKKSREIPLNPERLQGSIDVEASAHQEWSARKLEEVGHSLPADLRETWQLRQQGLDYQQIADRLTIPLGTVKSRFSRLVTFMKKEFEK